MGVPKFFRYISERYPCLSELAREEKIPEFDNLYLDMNGIIHTCSHPDDSNVHFRITEEEMHRDIFNYLDKLFFLIKPRKLFFLAVDGVAPRAKMNQQRSRRFRSAKEAELLEQNAIKRGETLPETARFDSNCITPGTEFMVRLQNSLKRFIKFKIGSSKQWQGCRIILSGHETPGEGEHKIMDYIRYLKNLPDYDPATRHCLYGLDADLIVLGLCTHQTHFSLLREEVLFGRKAKRTSLEETRFFLLHLTLLKDYLELEFDALKSLTSDFDVEKLVDDWILMGFLVGNDFIPHLPNMHINTNALTTLHKAYIECWPELGGYINENGDINLERFQIYMDTVAKYEREHFNELNEDAKYFESKHSNENNSLEFDFDTEEMQMNDMESDLQKLVEQTQMAFDDFEDNPLTLEDEFTAYKRSYYINKLKYDDVTPEVLAEQTECYVTALQWILHYYYKGVPSWGWFYPHHYAPFASDLKNIKNLKIKYDLGRPFLPFQQLLAVLPAASGHFLPSSLRDLMINPNSSLIKYYPSEFETDLNGKKQDWEAVVLIPFIDEKELLNAMEAPLNELTKEEMDRNIHGPMLQYDYIKPNSLKNNLLYTEKEIWNNDILVKSNPTTNCKERKIVHAGFPTMKHLNYTGQLQSERVKVFDYPSRNQSMILYPEVNNNLMELEKVAEKCLNKKVFIGWPHLIEAKVVAVSSQEKIIRNKTSQDQDPKIFGLHCRGIQEHNMKRKGIDFGHISVLIHASPIIGKGYIYNDQGRVTVKKEWSTLEIAYPAHGTVFNTYLLTPEYEYENKIENVFPMGSSIFMLGSPYYGCEGEIIDPFLVYSCGRMKVSVTVLPEPDFSEAKQIHNDLEAQYYNSYDAGLSLGVQSNCIARITGCILIIKGTRRECEATENNPKVNIGLNLRFNKNNEEVLGYTRKAGNLWLYSAKAINLIAAYHERFPEVFNFISTMGAKDVLFESDIFSDEIKLSDVTAWIKEQDHNKAERVACGTKTIQKEALDSVISSVENLKVLPVRNVKLQVKPHLVLKPGFKVPETHKLKRSLRLFDRVVVIKNTFQVPFGHRGTIVALHPIADMNPVRIECINSVEMFYEVLLDKEITERKDSCNGLESGRIFRISENALLPTIDTDKNREQENVPKNKPIVKSNSTLQNDVGYNTTSNRYRNVDNAQVEERKQDLLKIDKSIRGCDENNWKSSDLCKSFNNIDINKRDEDMNKLDFTNTPTAKKIKYAKSDNVDVPEKQNIVQVKSIEKTNTFNSSIMNTTGAKESRKYQFNSYGDNIIIGSANSQADNLKKKFTIEIANKEQTKNNSDNCEALKELLGINKNIPSSSNEKPTKMAPVLPQPPTRWKNNLLASSAVPFYLGQYPTYTNMPQGIHTMFSGPLQVNPNLSAGQQFLNAWNLNQTAHTSIPLQDKFVVKSNLAKETAEVTSNANKMKMQSNFRNFNETTDNRSTEGKTVVNDKCDEHLYKKKKKGELKRKTPKIAAKFDYI